MDTKYIIAYIMVPLAVAAIGYFAVRRNNKQTAGNKTGISAGGDVNISGSADIHVGDNIYGITLEEHKKELRLQEEKIRKELQETIQNEEYEKQQKLEIELKAVGEKLNNLQQSFEEETKRRKEADAALEEFRGELPEAKLEEAKEHLQSGDTKIAEELFDTIYDEGSVQVALAAYQSGRLAEGRIDYTKAMQKYRKAVEIEGNNPDYLLAAATMARTLGDYKEAQSWLEKLLHLRQKKTTKTIELALAQNELAHLYYNMGKYAEAQPLYNRSLEIREKSLGKYHPEVAATMDNLAQLYMKQNQYEKSNTLFTQVLEIREKSLGKEHPDVATTLNNLAVLYLAQGKYAEAEPLFIRVQEIDEKTIGKDHPDVAATLYNLAGLYWQQDKYEEAEPLFTRSLDILRRIFPNGHPNIDTIESNYAAMKAELQSKQ